MIFNSTRGSTIVEGLVALGILAIVFMSLLSGFTNIFRIEMSTTQIVNEQQILAMIIESIKAEPTAYVKDFSKTDVMTTLTPENLPLGYTKFYFGPKKGCGALGCESLIGYTIKPIGAYQGLFQGTIIVYRPKRIDGKIVSVSVDKYGDPIPSDGEAKTYNFLINSN